MSQLISQSTHFRQNSHSCIDLIIMDQPNLIVDSGVQSSLHKNCQHEIIYGVTNLQIPSPPPFKRRVWKYHKANVESLRSDISRVDWEDEFRDLDSHEATNCFTGKFLGLVSTHVPNSEIVCNAKDPPWITKHVKNAIRRKHRIYRKYVNNGRKPGEWGNVKLVRNETTRVIDQAKEGYFKSLGEKLCGPSKGIKLIGRPLIRY